MNRNLAVIALGGNAISPPGQSSTIEEQFAHMASTARVLVDVLEQGTLPVITHGNGPQVGELLRRVEASRNITYPLPLDTCVADTMGGMGYMIQQCMSTEMARRGIEKAVTTLITRSLVHVDDPAFENPTKPIGPFYTRQECEQLQVEHDWTMIEDSGRGYRRVVISPRPQKILEIDAIRRLVEDRQLVVACGGGGIPVIREDHQYQGVEAVVDKDRASALLAIQLDVDTFVITTDVDAVCKDYGTPDEQRIRTLPLERAKEWLDRGTLPAGSMGPKVESAVRFVNETGREARIGALDDLESVLEGEAGTTITTGGSVTSWNES